MGDTLRLKQLHTDLSGHFNFSDLGSQVVLDDHGLEDRVSVFFLGIEG